MRLLMILILVSVARHGQTHNAKTTQAQCQSSKGQDPVYSSVDYPAKTISSTDDAKKEHAVLNRKWDDPQWWSVWVNGCIALTTLATLFLLDNQITAIRNTERAFLIPIWERWPRRVEGTKGEAPSFEWEFKNCGKTPAFVRESVAHLILIDSLDNLPKKPDYSGAVTYHGDPLIPRQEMDRNFFSQMKDSRDSITIEDEHRTGSKILYAYGMVRYDDMYGRSHETRFGVRFTGKERFSSMDEFVVDGPKQYNGYR